VPPRVEFPDDPAKQAVVDAFYAYSDAFLAAAANPSDQSLREALRSTVTEPLLSRLERSLDGLVADGEVVIQNPDVPTRTEIIRDTVFFLEDAGTFDACAIDANIVVEPGGNPDGTDRVVDDDIVAAALTYHLDRIDGRWLVSDLERFGLWEGQEECGEQ
jgi:hypothetical protein